MSDNTLAPLQIELREAMREWGCPLCRLAAKAEKTYLDSLNYERVLDLTTRAALQASRGLCAVHSRRWRALQGSALGIAIVYRVTVLDLLRATDLQEARGSRFLRRGPSGPRQVAASLEPSGPCPACCLMEETAQRFADLLLQELKSPEVQALLLQSGGLCLPHLRMTLRRPGAGKTGAILVGVQRQAWEALMGELEEFIRKNDYRFRREPVSPAEADSWIRALDALVGLEDGK